MLLLPACHMRLLNGPIYLHDSAYFCRNYCETQVVEWRANQRGCRSQPTETSPGPPSVSDNWRNRYPISLNPQPNKPANIFKQIGVLETAVEAVEKKIPLRRSECEHPHS
ncbi:hypothetical protein EYF80_030205 [Liparis tanakae]|uniref:Uncharacterized protein n=1 Tax=Liparis tanakae TaxID=230148 RepID=A0A4Z2H2M3_9TELE|nr:hypothetical protein EYF80_030205 [Liparis tanakae]